MLQVTSMDSHSGQCDLQYLLVCGDQNLPGHFYHIWSLCAIFCIRICMPIWLCFYLCVLAWNQGKDTRRDSKGFQVCNYRIIYFLSINGYHYRGWGPLTKRASCQSVCPPMCCNQELDDDPPDPTDTSAGVFQSTQLNNVNKNHETTVQTAIRMSNLRDWLWSFENSVKMLESVMRDPF